MSVFMNVLGVVGRKEEEWRVDKAKKKQKQE